VTHTLPPLPPTVFPQPKAFSFRLSSVTGRHANAARLRRNPGMVRMQPFLMGCRTVTAQMSRW
jgi:hypothetical protein